MKEQVTGRINRGLFLVSAFLALTCGSDDYRTDTLTGGEFIQTSSPIVQLAWDANTEFDLAGYWLYQSRVSGRYAKWKRVLAIPADEETCAIGPLRPGTYFWVLTAFDGSRHESNYSNEVSAIIE
jgi:hypothetical protein